MKNRLILVLVKQDDIDFLVKLHMDRNLWSYEPIEEIPTDLRKVYKRTKDNLNNNWRKEYIIKLNNEDNTIIGSLSLECYTKHRKSWEIGYCILPEYQRKGYCFEAIRMALKYAFEDFDAHKVFAMCNEYNVGSYCVLERTGFTKEGIFKEELPWKGKWVDQYFYSLLDSEYFQTK